jgi:hypothetical protein
MAQKREGYHDFFAQIPNALWQALSAEAEADDRTVTAQFIRILKQRYPHATQTEAEAPPAKKKGKGK